MASSRPIRFAGIFVAIVAAAISGMTSTPARASATVTIPPGVGVGAVAFAKVSTNLSSSIAPSYFAADPSGLGQFYTPSGVTDNGLTSAAAATPCPTVGVCEVPTLVPGSQGEAIASADLASGTLRVFAFSDGRTDASGAFRPLVESEAIAGFRDVITALEDGILQFDLRINGTDTNDLRDGGTQDFINFLINGAFAQTSDGRSLASNDGVTGFGCGGSDGVLTTCNIDFLVNVPVTAGQQLDLSLLFAVVAGDGTADYRDTLSLSASGVQFSSASGIFLTGANGGGTAPPVPELSTWAMFLLGFGGVGIALRRNRKRVLSQIV